MEFLFTGLLYKVKEMSREQWSSWGQKNCCFVSFVLQFSALFGKIQILYSKLPRQKMAEQMGQTAIDFQPHH